ncbi:MAG TPA: F0F1 ATP synthase subunit B [Bacteroidales bacterium]|nr:F0F1 ATP synthase subunit B [Bacteroidales bacterium]HPR56863.1 F0F1 ATP synthase subunit B [Bacteroidales bacterium]HRW96528.1 F0F1 ATP synthase subunit B [Bacteroidales bacterium]
MELVSPGLGLVFWMALAFGVVLWVLGKYAWKPIMKSIQEREDSIDKALQQAETAREQLKNLHLTNEQLINEAKMERDRILKDTMQFKEKLIAQAKEKATQEADLIVEKTREKLEFEKKAAMVDLKNQIGQLSLEIAEKLLNRELSNKDAHKEYVEQLIRDVKLN